MSLKEIPRKDLIISILAAVTGLVMIIVISPGSNARGYGVMLLLTSLFYLALWVIYKKRAANETACMQKNSGTRADDPENAGSYETREKAGPDEVTEKTGYHETTEKAGSDEVTEKAGSHETREKAGPRAVLEKENPLVRYLPVLILSVLSFVAAYMMIDKGHGWGDDFAEYIADARALASGEYDSTGPFLGYGASYPLGTGIILLPVWLTKGLDLMALKLPQIFLYSCTLIILYRFYEKRTKDRLTLFIMLMLFAFNLSILKSVNTIGSDLPFLFFSTASLYLFYDLFDRNKGRREGYIKAVLAAACVLFGIMLRFQGVVLFLTFFCCDLLVLILKLLKIPGEKISLHADRYVHGLFYASFAGLFFMVNLFIPVVIKRSDIGFLEGVTLKSIASNAGYYFILFWNFFRYIPLTRVLWAVFTLMVVLGVVKAFRQEIISIVYSAGILMVYDIWKAKQGTRFIFPLFPIAVLFAWYGIHSLKNDRIRYIYAALSLSVGVCFIRGAADFGRENLSKGRDGNYGAFSDKALEGYEYISYNTPEDAKILTAFMKDVFLMTGRTVEYHGDTVEEMNALLPDYDYYLSATADFMGDPMKEEGYEYPEGISLSQEYDNGLFTLYKVKKDQN